MREKELERRFRLAAEKRGGMALKLVSPGTDGMPDRLLLLAGGRIAFVEVKAPGQKPRPLQLLRHRQLRDLGFRVYVLDGKNGIEEILDEICNV